MMDYSNAVRLVLKLFGIGLIVYGAVSLATYLPSLVIDRGPNEIRSNLPYILPLAVPFLFGAFLWLFPAKIANTVVGPGATKNFKNGFAEELERVGISLIGLYLFYRVTSDISYFLMSTWAKANILGRARFPEDFSALVASTVIELVLALFFMLRSRGIVNLLRKARGS
jgi:hypothetical protein